MNLPKIGDVFEFDYTYRNEKTEVVQLIIVDVTDEHVLYKMPSVSVNKIFRMTHDVWIENTDKRRPVSLGMYYTPSGQFLKDASDYLISNPPAA